MTQLTRDVVGDLWPLYAAGELSSGTRAVVQSFLDQDPEFAQRLRKEGSDDLLAPIAVALPMDHERATLLRAQRRRAVQSMVVNALALLASAVLTAFGLWTVVPVLATSFEASGAAMPGVTRATIVAATWVVRLTVPFLALVAVLFWARPRLKLPESIRSGTGLAIATAVVLFLVQLAWLSLLIGLSSALAARR
jgi:anti-sigma factor RsiW